MSLCRTIDVNKGVNDGKMTGNGRESCLRVAGETAIDRNDGVEEGKDWVSKALNLQQTPSHTPVPCTWISDMLAVLISYF